MLEMKTELGEIRFSANVIKKIVTDAVHLCNGKVYIYHYKGKYQNAMSGRASKMTLYNGDRGDPNSIEVVDSETGLKITAYLVVKFGTSIKKSCIDILYYISRNVETILGEKPESIRLIVTGIESNEIAKRHLEYSMETKLPEVINEPS